VHARAHESFDIALVERYRSAGAQPTLVEVDDELALLGQYVDHVHADDGHIDVVAAFVARRDDGESRVKLLGIADASATGIDHRHAHPVAQCEIRELAFAGESAAALDEQFEVVEDLEAQEGLALARQHDGSSACRHLRSLPAA
jgi:hypothetical protein